MDLEMDFGHPPVAVVGRDAGYYTWRFASAHVKHTQMARPVILFFTAAGDKEAKGHVDHLSRLVVQENVSWLHMPSCYHVHLI